MAAPTPSASGSNKAAVANSPAPSSGAAPALSGTGTKDYVPLWLSSTRLGNSKLFQGTAGNIGLGTKTPGSTLEAYVTNTGNLGLTLTLFNGGIGPGASSSLVITATGSTCNL